MVEGVGRGAATMGGVERMAVAAPEAAGGRAEDSLQRRGRGVRSFLELLDRKAEYWLNLLFYAYILAIIFFEVVSRYVLKASVAWAEETAIYAFIWLSYLSAARLARTRSHLSFTLLRDAMGPRGQLACLLVSDACLIGLSLVVIGYMFQPIRDSIAFEQSMLGANLPIWLATISVPVGWTLVLIRTLQRALDSVRAYRRGHAPVSDSLNTM